MKKVIIENYIQGLASYLDEKGYTWENLGDDRIAIFYTDESDLFHLAFNFGKFFCEN